MIEKLEDLVEQKELPENPIKNMRERIHIEMLTPLQKIAFNTDEFWNKEKNLLIQGATSSGKTLVSEILALKCMDLQNKVIYLAPLRAMVAEKYDQFRKDFEAYSDMVYASSSDYLMNDEDIIAGKFDMAVIVYEKFFAMLTEDSVKRKNGNSNMMSDCGLIIVDELQMLSVDQRGPKLEFALAKVLQNRPDIRIVGLTTCYSDIEDLKEWLKPVKVISNNDRMLPMIEHVICCNNGKYIRKYNPAINEYYKERKLDREQIMEDYEKEYREGKNNWETLLSIELPEYSMKKEKENTLREVLRKEFKDRKQICKAIVFTHSKRNARYLASRVTELFDRRNLNSELVTELNNLDDGEEIQEMRDRLFTYGVAYHHSSLSSEVRQLIEEEFSKLDGALNVIIATETLAIGVNLPADVIVVYDNEIMRSNWIERLEPQAYKNYIGRAGRLGVSSDAEAASYLIASTKDEMISFCERYIEAKPCLIKSAYSDNMPIEQAPFVLNGLPSEGFTEKNMQEIFKHTMYAEKNMSHAKEILDQLKDYKLVKKAQGVIFFGGPGAEQYYLRTEVGVALAPFALSLRACQIISFAFYRGKEKIDGMLPDSYQEEDLKNERYILDILYLVCMMPEVIRLNAPNLPSNTGVNSNPEPYIAMRNCTKKYLKKRYEEDENVFWENSLIKAHFFEDAFEQNNMHAIVKAILLELWIKGNTIEDIRKKTGFSFRFNIGDLDHLGDVASYLVEAISKVVDYNDVGNERKLMRPFYQLSRRIRYGATSDMVRVLNCHVHKIGRYKVIRLAKAIGMDEKYGDLLDFFRHASSYELEEFHFKEKQRQELCEILNRKYNHGSTERRVEELYYDNLVEQVFLQAYYEYSVQKSKNNLITLLKAAGINVEPLYIMGYSDLIYVVSYGSHEVPFFFLNDDKKNKTACTLTDIVQYQNVVDVLNQKIVFVSPSNFSTDINNYAQSRSDRLLITRRALIELLISSLNYRRKDADESLFFNILEGYSGIMDEHSVATQINLFDDWKPQRQRKRDVFLSYAHDMEESQGMEARVAEFALKLKEKEISYFFDVASIRAGDHFVKALDYGLTNAKVFILFVNTRYGRTSWTCEEMYSAIKAQIEKERLVIPMIFDEDGRKFWEEKALVNAIQYKDCTSLNKRENAYSDVIGRIMEELNV